jgi:hypothetical protein
MTFLLFSCSDYHPNFIRENPDACSQISRGGGKAYAAVSKKTNKSKSHTAEPKSISNSPSVPPGVSVFARTTKFPPSILRDGEKTSVGVSDSAPTTKFPSIFGNWKDISVPQGEPDFARTTKFPSMFEHEEDAEKNADVLRNLYKKGRRTIPSTKIRSSSTSSPAPIPPLDSQTASHRNEQLGTIQAPLKLMEAVGDLIDDDEFEPIPLSQIEGIQPTSKQLPDEQTVLSSAEHGLSTFEPRSIEDMIDQPNGASTWKRNILTKFHQILTRDPLPRSEVLLLAHQLQSPP